MAFTYTITNVANNITVNPSSDSITITKTTSSVSINPNATIIQTKNTADTYRGAWTSGETYFRGDTATYNNILYLATDNVTSSTNPASDTTNWTQYVVASSTSTFVRLTATNAIVAKAQAVFAFEDTANATQSTIALNTGNYQTLEIEAPAGGVQITGSERFNAGVAGFDQVSAGALGVYSTGDIQTEGALIGASSTISNLTIWGETLQNGLLAAYLTNGTTAITLTDTGISFASDTSLNFTSSAINFQNQASFSSGLVSAGGVSVGSYQNQIQVIDSNGNWVGPAITDSPQESVSGITGTTQTQIDSFDYEVYDTAKYFLKLKDGSDLHIVEIILAYDGTDILKSEYGVITNNGLLGTFQADIVGGNVRLLFTPAGATDLNVKVEKTLMAV